MHFRTMSFCFIWLPIFSPSCDQNHCVSTKFGMQLRMIQTKYGDIKNTIAARSDGILTVSKHQPLRPVF